MSKRNVTYLTLVAALFVLVVYIFSPSSEAQMGKATDFSLFSLEGEELSLSDFRGKPVVAVFFTVNCPFCVTELSLLEKLYREYKDKASLQILAINIRDGQAAVEKMLSDLEKSGVTLSYPVLLDQAGETAMKYQILGVPTTFFIDPLGNVSDVIIGAQSEEVFRRKLNQILWCRELKEIEVKNLFQVTPGLTVLDLRQNPQNPYSEQTQTKYLAQTDASLPPFSELDPEAVYLVLTDNREQALQICQEMVANSCRRVYYQVVDGSSS
ncbi:MAG: hypothetical protein PWP04_961 [Candidatus Atribacteria bacterium]|nr:hypothetical protein [Candidatus Atribacteria bacterium]